MNCYLRLAGAYPITKLSLNFEERPTTEPGFVSGNAKPDKEISSLVDSFGSKVRKVPPQEVKTEQKEEKEQKEKQVEEKHPKDGNTQNTTNSSGSFVNEPQVENAPEQKTQGLFKDW